MWFSSLNPDTALDWTCHKRHLHRLCLTGQTGLGQHAQVGTNSKSSSVCGHGAGLVMARADPDYGWESNVSGEAAF